MDPANTRETNANRIVAYCSPFVVFMVFCGLEAWEPLKAYYPWLNGLKSAVVMGLWWRFRRAYPRWSWNGVLTGIVVGVIGVVLWIFLAGLKWESEWASILPDWLYSAERPSFNPVENIATRLGQMAFILVRMTELALVVPLMEEVFWRGFLMRYCISEEFEKVSIGQFTPFSFAVVTAGFVVVHPELLAALVWGTGVNLLLYWTKNLSACIVAHAVTNFLLGAYILSTGEWALW
jgi:hypothetical protein